MRVVPDEVDSSGLSHVVVFIRQMSMILNNNKEDLTFAL